MNLPRVLTIECDSERLPIGTAVLPSHVLRAAVQAGVVILWDFRGLWGLISPEAAANALDSFDQWQAARGTWNRAPDAAMGIAWSAAVPVAATVARMLKGNSNLQKMELSRLLPE
ncbi:MAG: hypothetical protein NTW96_27485 [Planctomycetia bacterium]|nr:hypothetical protein [Planctomycetia bacterium]